VKRTIELEIEGRRVRVLAVRAGRGVWIGWSGRARFIAAAERSGAEKDVEEREIRAPMTGRVVQVLARPGVAVRARDPLVILEAMKMEYRVGSPRDGVVDAVDCSEGGRVELGQILVRLAP
jgi:biotin carboxyl carrier protein